MTQAAKRQPPTSQQILDEQTKQAERDLQRGKANLPAVAQATAPALVEAPAVSSADEYLNRNPGGMVIGHPIRPNAKLGKFVLGDSDGASAPDVDLTVITESITAGWVRLEEGQPPQYETGLLFDPNGFRRPARSELGDNDPAQWPISKFTGEPADPWLECVYVPLEDRESGEMYTLQIQAKPRSAALFAVDGLLRHCSQLIKRHPDCYPVIRLKSGSYESKKFGTQWKPVYAPVGKTPKASAAKPDTSTGADMSDAIPF
jgi:hypothetical protein